MKLFRQEKDKNAILRKNRDQTNFIAEQLYRLNQNPSITSPSQCKEILQRLIDEKKLREKNLKISMEEHCQIKRIYLPQPLSFAEQISEKNNLFILEAEILWGELKINAVIINIGVALLHGYDLCKEIESILSNDAWTSLILAYEKSREVDSLLNGISNHIDLHLEADDTKKENTKNRSQGGKNAAKAREPFKMYCEKQYLAWKQGEKNFASDNDFAARMINDPKNKKQDGSPFIENESTFTRGGKYGWIKQWNDELKNKNTTP